MADQQPQPNKGVSRRQFLRFAGLGLAAGFAAMFVGGRLRGGDKRTADIRVPEDSMFRPRASSGPNPQS